MGKPLLYINYYKKQSIQAAFFLPKTRWEVDCGQGYFYRHTGEDWLLLHLGLALLQTGGLVRDEVASPCRLSKAAARGLFTLYIRREVCYLNRSDGTFRKDVMKK